MHVYGRVSVRACVSKQVCACVRACGCVCVCVCVCARAVYEMPYFLPFRPIHDDDSELGLVRVVLRGEGVLKCFDESLLRVWLGP